MNIIFIYFYFIKFYKINMFIIIIFNKYDIIYFIKYYIFILIMRVKREKGRMDSHSHLPPWEWKSHSPLQN